MNPYWQTGLHCTLLRIGIVPPARNFAVSPETAVTVGSASVWATPCRSKACKVALMLWLPLNQFRVASEARRRAPLIANGGVEREASVWPAAAQVDAELLDDVAPNLGDRDAQADLVGAADRESVDHFSLRAAGRLAAGRRRRLPLEPFEMEIEGPVPELRTTNR